MVERKVITAPKPKRAKGRALTRALATGRETTVTVARHAGAGWHKYPDLSLCLPPSLRLPPIAQANQKAEGRSSGDSPLGLAPCHRAWHTGAEDRAEEQSRQRRTAIQAPRFSFPSILCSFFYLHVAPGTSRELNTLAIQSCILKKNLYKFLNSDGKRDCERERRNLEEVSILWL